jgi:hypothetical protein
MYVIISYHVIGWPNGYRQPANPGNPADTYDTSMSVATSFWNSMSQTYGSDTRIIFDLWNEPVNPVDLTSDPSDPNPLWPVLKTYYETLIHTIRSNHAQNILIATGNRWASWLVGIKESPLSDPNMVYAYHKYSVPGHNTASVWDQDTGGLIGVKPVIVSEWGYEDVDAGADPQWPGTAPEYGIPFTRWLEKNKLSNLVWIYHYDWTPALLKSNGSLTLYGNFAKNYIASHNAPRTRVAFSSVGAQDGWLLESTETSNQGGSIDAAAISFKLGDGVSRQQYRAVLSFNTSSLPDTAVVTAATLTLHRQSITGGGDPFNIFQGLFVDVRKGFFGTAASLQAADFQAAASKSAGPFNPTPVGTLYTINLPSTAYASINKLGTNGGVTQLRLRFKLDDNNNAFANFISFFSGDYAAVGYRPALVIQYYLP